MDGVLATINGQLAEAVDIARRIEARGEELGLPRNASIDQARITDLRSRIYLRKNLETLEHAYRVAFKSGARIAAGTWCLVLAHLGRNDDEKEILKCLQDLRMKLFEGKTEDRLGGVMYITDVKPTRHCVFYTQI